MATDADLAGQVAAERDFWMLTPHGLDPGYARFPDGLDPADLLAQRGPAALTAALASGQTLGDQLLSERLDNLAPEQARVAAMRVLAARPSHAWAPGTDQVRARLQLAQLQARRDLRDAVKTWDADPRKVAQSRAAQQQRGPRPPRGRGRQAAGGAVGAARPRARPAAGRAGRLAGHSGDAAAGPRARPRRRRRDPRPGRRGAAGRQPRPRTALPDRLPPATSPSTPATSAPARPARRARRATVTIPGRRNRLGVALLTADPPRRSGTADRWVSGTADTSGRTCRDT